MSGHDALGLIETRGLVAALEAADAALKAASVRLVGIKKTVPALMTVQLAGETAAVRAAVDSGRAAAERVGVVVSTHVIPRPDPAVDRMLGGSARPAARSRAVPETASPPAPPGLKRASKSNSGRTRATFSMPPPPSAGSAPAATGKAPDLEAMTVRELRALARTRDDLPIQGREIARANKAELLKALGGS